MTPFPTTLQPPLANVDPSAVISFGVIVGHQPVQHARFGRPTSPQAAAEIAADVFVDAYAVIFAGARIGIGTFIGLRATIREGCTIGARCMIGADVFFNYGVTCGNDVRIIQGAHIGGMATIGDGTFIGPGVQMSNVRHIDPWHQVFDHEQAEPVQIGRRVVIGAGAILLAGVNIGDEAVIGSGAVVTKDVPAGETWVGNPAHLHARLQPEDPHPDTRDSRGRAVLGFAK